MKLPFDLKKLFGVGKKLSTAAESLASKVMKKSMPSGIHLEQPPTVHKDTPIPGPFLHEETPVELGKSSGWFNRSEL